MSQTLFDNVERNLFQRVSNGLVVKEKKNSTWSPGLPVAKLFAIYFKIDLKGELVEYIIEA